MKKKSTIQLELERRQSINDDAYELIGAELKRRRVGQSQTLSSVAGDVCSISYLCKVEKNQLKPNRYLLKEICKKLNFESPKVNLLFKMRDFLDQCVCSFADNQMEKIDQIYQQSKEFDNYKTRLIALIYCLAHRFLYEAKQYADELLKLITVMKDKELVIFVLFYAVLKYYEEDYLESLDNLSEIKKMAKEDRFLYLTELYTLFCYYKLNHPFTLKTATAVMEYCLERSDFEKIFFIRYLLGLYYLKNRMMKEAFGQLICLRQSSYFDSFAFLLDLAQNTLKNQQDYQNLRPFATLLHTYCFDKKSFRKKVDEISEDWILEIDFNINILTYLAINEAEDQYNEIIHVLFPNVLKTKNRFDGQFFLDELWKHSLHFGRYKAFTKAYQSYRKEVEQ